MEFFHDTQDNLKWQLKLATLLLKWMTSQGAVQILRDACLPQRMSRGLQCVLVEIWLSNSSHRLNEIIFKVFFSQYKVIFIAILIVKCQTALWLEILCWNNCLKELKDFIGKLKSEWHGKIKFNSRNCWDDKIANNCPINSTIVTMGNKVTEQLQAFEPKSLWKINSTNIFLPKSITRINLLILIRFFPLSYNSGGFHFDKCVGIHFDY